MTTNDVEKRWHDPAAFRAASVYVASIIAVAGLAFVLFLLIGREVPLSALGTPIVLLVGGIAAFIKTYRVWRAGGTWPIWQGAGWFLLTVMLVSLSIPGMAISPSVTKSQWAVQFSALPNRGTSATAPALAGGQDGNGRFVIAMSAESIARPLWADCCLARCPAWS